jgi:hypothetical protein
VSALLDRLDASDAAAVLFIVVIGLALVYMGLADRTRGRR